MIRWALRNAKAKLTGWTASFVPEWVGAVLLCQPLAVPIRLRAKGSVGAEDSVSIDALADEVSLSKGEVAAAVLDVYLPPELFFERRLVLPVTACDKLQEVALLDLQSRTPFELADIYWRLGRPAKKNSVIEVSQWIVRREDVQSWKHNLERNGYRVCKLFVDIDSAPLPVVDFSDEILPGRQTFRKLNIALACTALLSLFSAWLYPGWSARIDTRVLQLELDTLRSQALLERHKVEEIRQTEAQKTTLVDAVMLRPLLVDTLRELTISLEDDVWVSSMAFNTSRVVITGEAGNSAAEAVLSLGERSGFGNPRISGPVSRTARGSEQFEITLDLGAPG